MIPLLTVQDRLPLDKLGLMLAPDFAVPKGGWEDRSETVTVAPPAGEAFETPALITASHLCVSKGAKDRGWRIVVILFSCTEKQVPAGSTILAAEEIVRELL
jgi:hypothetical protein